MVLRRTAPLMIVAGVLLATVSGCSPQPTAVDEGEPPARAEAASSKIVLSSYEDLANTRFGPEPADVHRVPRVVQIPLPELDGAYAIWGATGRDHLGHIWIGVSSTGSNPPSAHLLEYRPEQNEIVKRGDVVSELKRAGIYRDGEGQMKIHSKIVEAADGNLYFTSMDESGENEDGSELPTWGSHLWRVRPPDYQWEHLAAAPEGLIAVSGVGPRIYALGYFGHMLYQFDTESGALRSIRVGSVGGHISRNLVSDEQGHVYVPRLTYQGAAELAATLVEFSPSLQEVAQTPIRHYISEAAGLVDSHGIVGFQHMADHSILFVTHVGYMYRITPHADRPADVTEVGWFHPGGEAYVASMFTLDGARYVAGVSNRSDQYECVVYDLAARSSVARPLKFADKASERLAVYGSLTRDNAGNFYLGGTYLIRPERNGPVFFQARPGS